MGFWLIIISNLVFALTDLRLAGGEWLAVSGLKLVQVAAVAVGFVGLRFCRSQAAAAAVILATAILVVSALAVSGAVSNDVTTTAILCLGLVWGAATLLPWGVGPQLALVTVAIVGMLLNLGLTRGNLSDAASYPAVSIGLALGISVLLTDRFARNRAALLRENAERSRAELALRRSEADLRGIVDHLEDIFYRTDLDGTIRMLSPSVARYGYAVEELLGSRTTLFHVAPEVRAGHVARLLESGVLRDLELTLLAKDGTAVPVSANVHLLWDDSGQPVGIEGLLRDITERKQAETELQEARDALEMRVQERTAQLEASTTALARSEARFRSLIENGLDLISVLSDQGVFSYASPSNMRVLGYAPEELVGRSAFEFVHPDDALGVQQTFAGAVQHAGVTPAVEFRFRHRDGSWRFVEAIGNVVDFAGVAAVVINSHDITDRKHMEEALHAEAQVSQALAYAGRELISSLGKPTLLDRLCHVTAEVLAVNRSCTAMLHSSSDTYVFAAGGGYNTEALESLRALQIPRAAWAHLVGRLQREDVLQVRLADVPGLDPQAQSGPDGDATGLVMALRRGPEVIGLQVALGRSHGETFDAQQMRIGLGVAQLASLALEHTRLVAELEEANQVKSEFVATMSHELRTPLNVIIGYTGLLLDGTFGPLTADQTETLGAVGKNSRELLELITATLDLGRLENGRTLVSMQTVRAADLVAEVRVETSESLKRSGLRVIWNADDPGLLYTDPQKAKIVLKNLVANAVKFTEHGTVTIDTRSTAGGVEFTVADSGIGISSTLLPIIFEPFRQGDSSSTRRFDGVGLGLYIVRRLLELLGGTVAVRSEVGQGAVFKIWLPSAPPVSQLAQTL